MESVSVIIPARKERFLDNTIREVFEKFKGSFEVIVTLDGADANRLDKVKYIYNRKSKGMRTAINQAVALARGKYLMKLDAHCMLDDGIDEKLIAQHHPDWVQIPRRKRLDAKNWKIDTTKADIDYMYNNSDLMGIRNRGKNLDLDLKKKLIDDTESFQGSCYFIERAYFNELGLLDDVNFSGSGHESQEITIKVLADGGRVIRNKKTWYAHARLGRFYVSDRDKSRKYIHVLAKKYGYKSS
ncbi:glycosyltransferase [Candidatus Woesebacteria bacterium]|nr:glycosyltransferase [Candidatus Woesebacteria bacterium]